MAEPLLLAYLAGIIDGEGYVGVHSHGAGKNQRFVMQVNMTDKDIVELLHATLGGHMRYKKPYREGYKPQWLWRVTAKQARCVYTQLEPYLRLKRIELPA